MTFDQVKEAISARLAQESRDAATISRIATGQKDAISRILRGHNPALDRLDAICNAMGIRVSFGPDSDRGLTSEKSVTQTQISPQTHSLAPHDDPRVRRLQESLLAMSLALDELMPAETWGTADDDGLHTIGDGWFRVWMARHGAIPDQCGMTDVDTNEMEPTLPPGSAVVVDRSKRKPCEKGVFMLRTESGKRRVFRRFRRDEERRWVAHGDHPACKESKPMRSPDVVGRVLWSACDLRDDIGPFARTPRAVYMLFAREVGRPALVQAARDIPLEALRAFALEEAKRAEKRYAEVFEAAKAAGFEA